MSEEPKQADDVGGILKRVHLLGSATEELFSRLYGGLNRRKQLAEAAAQLSQMEFRNRQLRRALKQKTIQTERLNAILGSISEGIIMQDTEGRIVMMNDAAKEILGNQRNFWSSQLGIMFNENKDLPTISNELAPLGEAKQVVINNTRISAQIAAVTSQNAERIGTMMILRQSQQLNDFDERIKHSFVSHISHELITPLASMRVASEVLRNTPPDKPVNRRMLEIVGNNIDLLDRMVTEMLDMSAMTSGNLTVLHEPIALEDLVWDVVKSFEDDFLEARLDVFVMLKHTDNLRLIGDQKKLQWALSNLVRNAIQYNEAGRTVWVGAGIDHESPDEIAIEVADTGVGISENDMPYIFDLFFRGDPINSKGKKLDPRGLGQGLFVSRTIALAHGGNLSANSVQYEGSSFTMRLPRDSTKALTA
jgi:two-component system, OmpR family, sensor histidine kinase ResE